MTVWNVGDRYRTMHGHIFEVVLAVPGKSAWLRMIFPFRTKLATQKELPSDWIKLKPGEKYD